MNLRTQSAQVACFRNAANHLEPRGCFVVEVMVPELQRLPPGERHQVFKASENYWGIDQYDVVTQYGAAVAELEATMGNEFPPELVAMMGRLSRHTATPDVAVTIERIYTETDVRAILPSVSAPPLSCSPHGWKRPNMWPR
jgi:hypothetical protein